MDNFDLIAAMPLAVLLTGALFVLCFDLFKLFVPKVLAIGSFSLASLYVAYMNSSFSGAVKPVTAYFDSFSVIAFGIILGGLFLSICLQSGQLKAQHVKDTVDVDVLMCFAAIGAMAMVSAANFLVLFLGFEIMSISVYVLSGLARKEKASSESALKYFILGAFSSAFLLYGIALVYGQTGSLDFALIPGHDGMLLKVGLGLLLFGFAFKISAAPFHFWTPDVYQGAPVSITVFMATVVKAAAFGALMRILFVVFGDEYNIWLPLVITLSVLSMVVGNFLALRQQSVKRMLAYSSIAHAGYALMGFVANGVAGSREAVLFYLLAYVVMTIGSFGVVLVITAGREEQYSQDNIAALNGLGWQYPFLGLTMTVFMLSLAGIPPLVGFIGKFYLFSAVVHAGYTWLAIVAAINSVVSLYYYLRVVVALYFVKADAAVVKLPGYAQFAAKAAIAIACVLVVYFGLYADRFYQIAQAAVSTM